MTNPLNLVMETDLRGDPRVVDHFRTIETNYWGEFRSQVGAVDVAPEGNRYLFTLADEAWCCAMSGDTVWGVAMPVKEGWKRVVGKSERFGVGREVDEAPRLFGLSLPVEAAEIKRKYWQLAKVHHPDVNRGNRESEDRMKGFNWAFEVLTGVDPNTLGFEESDVTFFARTGPDYVYEMEGIRIEGQDDCKVRWHGHRGGRWSGWGGRRSFWLGGAWTSGRGTIRPGAGRSARCSPGWRIPRPTPDAAACGRPHPNCGPSRDAGCSQHSSAGGTI